jgi:hypothetical protein
MNYQQIGDVKSANKAIRVELEATQLHFFKAWRSRESYYRKKFVGGVRALMLIKWLKFKILDFIWGNGEDLLKLSRAVLIILVFIAVFDVFKFRDTNLVSSYVEAGLQAPGIFFGTIAPKGYATIYLSGIVFIRLVMIGFFMSIIIKGGFNIHSEHHRRSVSRSRRPMLQVGC